MAVCMNVYVVCVFESLFVFLSEMVVDRPSKSTS